MLPTKFQFIWESGFRGEDFFRNQPIRNKNGLWRPCLLTDRDEMSNLYRGLSIDASYQVSVHLAKQFQRRRFKKIGQSETRIACGGWGISEEKTKMWKVNGWQATDNKWWQKLTLPLARWANNAEVFRFCFCNFRRAQDLYRFSDRNIYLNLFQPKLSMMNMNFRIK